MFVRFGHECFGSRLTPGRARAVDVIIRPTGVLIVSHFYLLEDKRNEIASLCRRFAVTRLRVFGSVLGGEWNDERSDFDFLVQYGPEYLTLQPLERLVGLKLALEDLLGRKVDVVNYDCMRNNLLREAVESKAVDFYAA